jgi:subtilisin family serine protease
MSLTGSASRALDQAVAKSIAAGVTYVVAAGNDQTDACKYSPARAAAAITVGSTTDADIRASTSNYGSCLDLFAPGENIASPSAWSDVSTAAMSGTSMAAPHVAGVVALVLQGNPRATPSEVTQAIVSNATKGKLTGIGRSPNRLLYSGFIRAPRFTP